MKLQQKGQALVETCIILPVVLSILSSLILGIYFVLAHYLVDYWVYQSNLCLAAERPSHLCKKTLTKNLNLIPFAKFRINNFYKNDRKTSVYVLTLSPKMMTKKFNYSLSLPLTSKDFKRFQ